MNNNKLPRIVLIPLAILLVISLYQTAVGFERFFNSQILAILLSAAITIFMFVIAFYVGQQRAQRRPVIALIITYAICSLISYAGNFNSFYTQLQGSALYENELQEKKDLAKEVTESSTKALSNYDPENQQAVNELLILKNELISQIKDPANSGCGLRCKDIKAQIEKKLGRPLTEFSGSPNQLASSYNQLIDNIIEKKYQSGDISKVSEMIASNEATRDEVIKNIDKVLGSSDFIKSDSDKAIKQAVDKINTIGISTQQFINDPNLFSFTPVTFKNADMGKINFSWTSAQQNPSAFLFISFLSFIIDWAGLIFILLYTTYISPQNDGTIKKTTHKNKGKFIDINQ